MVSALKIVVAAKLPTLQRRTTVVTIVVKSIRYIYTLIRKFRLRVCILLSLSGRAEISYNCISDVGIVAVLFVLAVISHLRKTRESNLFVNNTE
jgi:hypothetical protein